ncbi:TetR family transcriptional regulator [Sciscionella sediminilitoris]|uniref:TetR family transcriptional regulator n=1 Tax=Sciscionella sediminilitoris TaxID=1445613 RepID=UPI0004DF6A7B|nr:TetR/AcrR family transcriptional regulator C-terminal domain-containing protein [Sciscionella sp. SE31]
MPIDRKYAAQIALRLLDSEGLDKLTVRRLATELGVKAPALYWHFPNKRALLDEMTDQLLGPVLAPLHAGHRGQPWWSWLAEAAETLWQGLLGVRDGARIASGADLIRARALGEFAELVTETLHRAGFPLSDASRASGAIIHFVLGRAVEDQTRGTQAEEHALITEETFPYPVLARSLLERHREGSAQADDFRYSLHILITGLRTIRESER